MTRPNWQETFRDLPEIPEHKKWIKGSQMTLEQQISFKLLHGQNVSKKEVQIFNSLISFYQELDAKLSQLDYTSFSCSDFENFKGYISYAFNYQAIIINEIKVFTTYRAVLNESVTGKDERINHIEFMKYPRLEIVRNLKKYNRANTPTTTAFYSSENIDTTLKELRPPKHKLVTVGIWKPTSDREFMTYPISHSKLALDSNESLAKATTAFERMAVTRQPQLINWMRHYFQLLGREFTKRTNHHYEYLITSLFSERIFENRQDSKSDLKFDCIIYPSVGNDYRTSNLAIRPSVVDSELYLDKAIEFEIEEPYYENTAPTSHAEKITIAKIKNVCTSRFVDKDGIIHW